eukprot:TRINITY_DN14854_c0_g1_i1.p1 TRINITY_DN14854_c0_g1~~TRINITY_DN14854_c0_g1_i1.p1  ORF type:complete len:585 (-),score=138.65 TRINITY_DN14854_c0_g1_i1:262-2016(-)
MSALKIGSRATEKELYERESKKTFSSLTNSEIKARLTPKEIRRQEAIFEIINTERQYVADLAVIIYSFVTPLQEKKILKQDDLVSLAPNIETIFKLNSNFLQELELRLRTSEERIITTIGDILIERVPTFSLYTPYCSNQPTIPPKLDDLRSRHSGFNDFMKNRPKEFRGLYLDDFLIKPVQRITKYPLLLRAVLENTEEDDPDRANINAACLKIKEIVNVINERTRQAEGRQKVLEVSNRLGVTLLSRSRLLIRQGNCTLQSGRGKNDSTSAIFYLFNDLLLWSRVRKGLIYQLSESTPKEDEIERVDLAFVDFDTNGVDGKTISISSTKESDDFRAMVVFNSDDERDGWLESIKTAVASLPKVAMEEGSPLNGDHSTSVLNTNVNSPRVQGNEHSQLVHSSSSSGKNGPFSLLKRLSSPPMNLMQEHQMNILQSSTSQSSISPVMTPPQGGSPVSSQSSRRSRPKTFSYTRTEEIGDVNSILREGILTAEELERKIELEHKCAQLRREIMLSRVDIAMKLAAKSGTEGQQMMKGLENLKKQMTEASVKNEELRKNRDSMKIQLRLAQSQTNKAIRPRGKKSK